MKIESFPQLTPGTLGGCRGFEYVPASELLHIPRLRNGQVPAPVILKDGSAFRKGYSTFKTLVFEEKIQENDSGKYYLCEIKGFYPKICHEILDLFARMAMDHFVVVVTDNNGLRRVCGTDDNPLNFSFDQGTGSEPASRAGISFSFRGQLPQPSPFYTWQAS